MIAVKVFDNQLLTAPLTSLLNVRSVSVEYSLTSPLVASTIVASGVRYVGFDAPEGVLVGYGLDYAGRYRNLRCCALLAPHVYAGRQSRMDGRPSNAPQPA